MGAITAYRFYYVDSDGQIDGPPTIVECKDDLAAIKTAGQLLLDGKDILAWDGDREVIRLAANLADPMSMREPRNCYPGAGRNFKALADADVL
jgi:hypothetical protein